MQNSSLEAPTETVTALGRYIIRDGHVQFVPAKKVAQDLAPALFDVDELVEIVNDCRQPAVVEPPNEARSLNFVTHLAVARGCTEWLR